MPQQKQISNLTGPVSIAVGGYRRDGTSAAANMFAKQGFTTVRPFMEDRNDLKAVGAPSISRAGETLAFEINPDHHLTSFVDIRFTLPGLNHATSFVSPTSGLTHAFNYPSRPGNIVNRQRIGVVYPGESGYASYRYRIPCNPGFGDLISVNGAQSRTTGTDGSDYAALPGGYPNPFTGNGGNYTGGVPTVGPVSLYPSTNILRFAHPVSTAGTETISAGDEANTFLFGGSVEGESAPNPIWTDYVGYHALEDIQVIQSVNEVQRFSGVDMWKMHQKWHNQETSEHYRLMTGGHAAGPGWSSEDVEFAAVSRDIIVPLDFLFWVGKITESLPVIGNSKAVQIKIKFRNPEYLYLFQKIQLSASPDATKYMVATSTIGDRLTVSAVDPTANNRLETVDIDILNPRLHLHQIFLPNQQVNQTLGELDDRHGYLWKNLDLEKQEDIPVSAANQKTSAILPITGIKGGVTSLFITKIHRSDKRTKFATFWTNFLRLNNYSAKTGNDYIVPITDHAYDLLRLTQLHNTNKLVRYNVYCHNYSKIPSDKFNSWGHLEYGTLFNPQLLLEYGCNSSIPLLSTPLAGAPTADTNLALAAPSTAQSTGSPVNGVDHVVDIMCLCHQIIQQRTGDLRKAFT